MSQAPVTLCTSVLFSDQLLGDASSTATCGVDKGPRLSEHSACSSEPRPGRENYRYSFPALWYSRRNESCGSSEPRPPVVLLRAGAGQEELKAGSCDIQYLSQTADVCNVLRLGCLCLVLGADPAPHRPDRGSAPHFLPLDGQ